jgi:hypothetical protein
MLCDAPPLPAVRVTVCVPADAEEAAVKVTVLVPEAGFAMLAGENDAVTPLGNPFADSRSGALNPFVTLVRRVVAALCPRLTVTAGDASARLNRPTFKVTDAVGEVVRPGVVPITSIV